VPGRGTGPTAGVTSDRIELRTARTLLQRLAVTDRDAFVELYADPRVSAVVGAYDGPKAVQRLEMIAPDNVVSVSVALQLGLRPERDEPLDGKPVRVYTLHRDAWSPPEGPARPA
jgi:hypothetical protein